MVRPVHWCGIGLLLLMLSILQSCTTLSKRECVGTDWSMIGERDGANGLSLSRISKHADACARVSIVPDYMAWREGHRVGARRFCTPPNAFALGNRGGTNYDICESDQRVVFEPVYQLGLRRHGLASEISFAQRAIRSYDSDIDIVRKRRDSGKMDEDDADREIDRLHGMIAKKKVEESHAEQKLERFNRQLLRDGYLKMAMPGG